MQVPDREAGFPLPHCPTWAPNHLATSQVRQNQPCSVQTATPTASFLHVALLAVSPGLSNSCPRRLPPEHQQAAPNSPCLLLHSCSDTLQHQPTQPGRQAQTRNQPHLHPPTPPLFILQIILVLSSIHGSLCESGSSLLRLILSKKLHLW